MFARDDAHRGRRWPLLWIFIPLIVGALVVTGLSVLAHASLGFPNTTLAEELDAAAGRDVPMSELTDFSWDRVCVVPPGASNDEVDELLGFEWGVVGGDRLANQVLLIFVLDDEVVTHLYLRRGVVAAPPATGDCRSPDDEATRV